MLPRMAQHCEQTHQGGIGLRAILLLMGFTSTVSQVLLMRELLVAFYGNEISLGLFLASWLLWTALGSMLFGLMSVWPTRPRDLVAVLQVLITVTLPLTIVAVRSSKGLFITVPGEMLGPLPMLLTAMVLLAPFCLVSGGMFSAGSRIVLHETDRAATSATGVVYLLEAAGAGIGGLIASLMLVSHLTSLQIAFLLGMLNLFAAASLTIYNYTRRWTALIVIAGMFLFIVLPLVEPALHSFSIRRLWRGFDLLTSLNSAYGNLAVVQTETNRTLLENAIPLFTDPDPEAAEETVHFVLLQNPAPKNVLLIGGGLNGSALEALKHPSIERLDFVELDPAIFLIGKRYFPEEMARLHGQPRVRFHATDGRLFLKGALQRYDVIIVNLPEPQTAQLNRFYTVEFFREAAAKLNTDGILSFQLRGAENYVTPTTAAFLSCINRSLREVFPDVTTIPGDTVHFFAAKRVGVLTRSSEQLLRRLHSRGLQTSYVREYYLPFRMAPDRANELEEQIRPTATTPLNRDFTPTAYYFDVALWSTEFNQGYRGVFSALARIRFVWILGGLIALLTLGVLTAALHRGKTLRLAGLTACVGSMGFTLMTLEVLLLLGFQAIYGYVYQQLALLVAAVMVGMALGSWWGLRHVITDRATNSRWIRLSGIQMFAAASPLSLFFFLQACSKIGNPATLSVVSYVVFPIAALLCGFLGGNQFPLASSLFYGHEEDGILNMGLVYAIDLAGACLGAILISTYCVPVLGFLKTSLLISILNIGVAALVLIAGSAEKVLQASQHQAASH